MLQFHGFRSNESRSGIGRILTGMGLSTYISQGDELMEVYIYNATHLQFVWIVNE